MKVIEPGHVYGVDTIDSRGGLESQTIRFLRRSSSLIQHPYEAEGTNTQEILRVAIDRTKYLDSIQPCSENEDILFCLRHALFLYEARPYRRKVNKVNKGQGIHPEGSEDFKEVPFDVLNCGMETSLWAANARLKGCSAPSAAAPAAVFRSPRRLIRNSMGSVLMGSPLRDR